MNRKMIDRAKQIIVEIIRQSGGEFHNKTNLYKAFWIAHLSFADATGGILSTWPIVKMPNGPGIDRHQILLGELLTDGIIEIEQKEGQYEAFIFRLSDKTSIPQMEDEELDAIKDGIAGVRGKSAKQVSFESHENSISWNQADIGEEMNLYLDIIPPADRETLKRESAKFASFASEVVGI
ncbi:hypothetical protein [Schlesneria sp. DSM 10557]|uniref:hypothetical protein n=1 Tax=Schlesneria sp. DSM 10557 TaxID=3044399 RepID=UPI0035A087A8